MKYSRFEELPVWQAGLKLTEDSFLLTDRVRQRDEQKKRSAAFLNKLRQVQQGRKP